MTFLWPSAFLVLALIPLLILLYVWRQRRRRRFVVRYSSLSLLRAAVPAQSRLRRYLPMALLFLALASLAVSLARPVTTARVPAGRATVMLVMDVSRSMTRADIPPSRLAAAKQAALQFIAKQKDTNQVGIVAFARFAQLVQPPSTDPEALDRAIQNLVTGGGTAIGEGIVTALNAIDEAGQGAGTSGASPNEGEFRPDIIVLLTDGANNYGVNPLLAAQQARDNSVRVYTIGYGVPSSTVNPDTSPRGRYFGFNEQALKAIAALTGGEYYAASSAGELQAVFDKLPTALALREERLEISVFFVALAAMLVTGAMLLSQLWHPLP